MKVSKQGIDLITRFEGFSRKAYQDSGGVWTIGYGHTGREAHKGACITLEEGMTMLEKDIKVVEDGLNKLLDKVPLTQNQFDALISFVFNIGLSNFEHSNVFRQLKRGRFSSKEFLIWKFVHGTPVKGLLNRRIAEKELFDS